MMQGLRLVNYLNRTILYNLEFSMTKKTYTYTFIYVVIHSGVAGVDVLFYILLICINNNVYSIICYSFLNLMCIIMIIASIGIRSYRNCI